jgi:GST-like protein
MEYPINRFAMETKRQLDVLDRHLATRDWMAGSYSIADMAIWSWYGQMALGRLYDAAEFLQVDGYEHLQRWSKQIDARDAVQRGRMVNRPFGDPAMQLHERHDASDFELRTQDRIRPTD